MIKQLKIFFCRSAAEAERKKYADELAAIETRIVELTKKKRDISAAESLVREFGEDRQRRRLENLYMYNLNTIGHALYKQRSSINKELEDLDAKHQALRWRIQLFTDRLKEKFLLP